MRAPVIQKKTSPKAFREAIAAHAADLHRWINLNVKSFGADPAARDERLRRVRDKRKGYRFFLETYLPHYVRGEASLFHEAVFGRAPIILGNEK
ncbi:MAG: hypothetical protein KDJ29_19705, partial [Hyphomicrobiales bacterium]|nr:hypothetical protein [Hyphomicrobiales bacterium]